MISYFEKKWSSHLRVIYSGAEVRFFWEKENNTMTAEAMAPRIAKP